MRIIDYIVISIGKKLVWKNGNNFIIIRKMVNRYFDFIGTVKVLT